MHIIRSATDKYLSLISGRRNEIKRPDWAANMGPLTLERIIMLNQSTVELQWLEQALDHENWLPSEVVPDSQGRVYIYKLNSIESSLIYGQSFRIIFSFSIFSNRRSLKIEQITACNNLTTDVSYGIIGTNERVLVRQGKRASRV